MALVCELFFVMSSRVLVSRVKLLEVYPIATATANAHVYLAQLLYLRCTLANLLPKDLFPPPVQWVPANCILEVDDVTKEWLWKQKFDLIHMRLLLGAFTPEERDAVYKSCYE